MRPLCRLPVPPGQAGVDALIEPVRRALDGTGPAIAPTPVTSVTVSDAYVARLLRALRPEDPAAPLESDDIAVVLATSGSTGDPSGVLHTAESLTALSAAVNGVGSPRWIAALPLTSMGGFNVLLRAIAAGHAPTALASLGGTQPFTPADFARAVGRTGSDDIRVSLVAAQVRRLLDDEEGVEALRACSQVLVGAGPTPEALLARAAELGIHLTRTYGSTETSGGCCYDGRALPGVSIAIDGGEVVVNGPMLARGYRCDPALTAQRFTSAGFRTRDHGVLEHDRLVVLGRLDDVVIVNGVNVALDAVQRTIEALAIVRAAAVVALPGDEPQIAAFIVAESGATVDAGAITSMVEHGLGRAARPRKVAVVPALPMLPNGKLDRAALRTMAVEGTTWLR